MKLRLKEDPREWRKSVLLTALGLAFISSVLHWRGVLPREPWLIVLGLAFLWSVLAWIEPRWFRGFYRFSMRAGVGLSHIVARLILVVVFILILTPLAFLLRLLGKDLLRLRRRPDLKSYWSEAQSAGPLDRMF